MPVRSYSSADRAAAPLPLHVGAYFSQSLGREQPYAYFAPPGFQPDAPPPKADAAETLLPQMRYPLLVLLHGRHGNHLTWPAQTRLARYAAAYALIIAFPEGGEGWYADAWDGQANYEADMMQDFLPHLQRTLPLLASGRHWAIGGMSMGGQGAVKIALRHGRMFGLAVSFSGAFEITRTPTLHAVFGDPQQHAGLRRASNVFALAEDALSTWPPARPQLYLACGEEDGLLDANRRFHQHLDFLGYRHTYLEQPGRHTLPYWDRAIRAALPYIVQVVSDP